MKKVIKFITNTIVVIVLIVALIVGYNWYQKKQGNVAYFFGYATYAVKGDSMRPTIEPGDLLIIHKEDSYKEGDVITFVNTQKQIVTHRIIGIDEDGMFITQGDNNKFEDSEHLSKNAIYGKVTYDITCYDEVVGFLDKYKFFLIAGFIILSVVGRLLL
jgi:signal peptidase